jgi:hypothetical protein
LLSGGLPAGQAAAQAATALTGNSQAGQAISALTGSASNLMASGGGGGGAGAGAGTANPVVQVAQGAVNAVVQQVANRDPVVRQVVQTVQDPGFQQVCPLMASLPLLPAFQPL